MSSNAILGFVTDLRKATAGIDDPAEAIQRVSPLMAKLASDTSWVRPEYYNCDKDQGFGITILNEDPGNALLVQAICWLPGRGVAPHDHQTWGIVMGVDGVEVNVDWRRNDDGSKPGYAEVEIARETHVTNGEIVSFLPDDIHGVRNESDAPSLSLHVYGRSPASMDRSEFDPINKTQKPCPERKRTVAEV